MRDEVEEVEKARSDADTAIEEEGPFLYAFDFKAAFLFLEEDFDN